MTEVTTEENVERAGDKQDGHTGRIDKIIEHLSNEIQKLMETTMTFRTRIAFIAWIGPFILLSSVLVSTQGIFIIPWDDWLFNGALALAALSYLGMGIIGGVMERQSWVRCDCLRQKIITYSKLSSTKDIEDHDLDSKVSNTICRGYMWAFVIIALSFIGVALAISRIDVKGQPEGGTPPAIASRSIGGVALVLDTSVKDPPVKVAIICCAGR